MDMSTLISQLVWLFFHEVFFPARRNGYSYKCFAHRSPSVFFRGKKHPLTPSLAFVYDFFFGWFCHKFVQAVSVSAQNRNSSWATFPAWPLPPFLVPPISLNIRESNS